MKEKRGGRGGHVVLHPDVFEEFKIIQIKEGFRSGNELIKKMIEIFKEKQNEDKKSC